MKVFKRFVVAFLPLNLRRAKNEPRGKAINVARSIDIPETLNETSIIPQISGSKVNINKNACIIPSIISFAEIIHQN